VELTFKYDIGDVVTIDGYGADKYEIFSVNADYEKDATEEYCDIYYECYHAINGELIIAYEKDVTLFGRPEKVDYERITYLYERANDIDLEGLITHISSFSMTTSAPESKEPEKERKDDAAKIDETLTELQDIQTIINLLGDHGDDAAKIDELLTELQDVQTLINLFGDHEDEEKRDYRYIQRKTEIEAQLRALSEKKGGR